MNFNFTKRELDVIKYVIQGKSNQEIAKLLNISIHTVKAHVCSMLYSTNTKNRTQLAYLLGKENFPENPKFNENYNLHRLSAKL